MEAPATLKKGLFVILYGIISASLIADLLEVALARDHLGCQPDSFKGAWVPFAEMSGHLWSYLLQQIVGLVVFQHYMLAVFLSRLMDKAE